VVTPSRRQEKAERSRQEQVARESTFAAQIKRQNGLCFYCGERMDGPDCTREHLLARALGGTNDPENIKAAHGDCNSAVGHMPVRVKLLLREYGLKMGRFSLIERARELRRLEARRTFKLEGNKVQTKREPGPGYWAKLGLEGKPSWWDG
jgi:hypothetical protein